MRAIYSQDSIAVAMSNVPHCPECRRADRVEWRKGPKYEYYCRSCNHVFEPDDVLDAAWIDIMSDKMFTNPDDIAERAEHGYSDKCECDWCEDGRPGMAELEA